MNYYTLTNIVKCLKLTVIVDGNMKPNPQISRSKYKKCLELINPLKWKSLPQFKDVELKMYRTKCDGTLMTEELMTIIWNSVCELLPYTPNPIMKVHKLDDSQIIKVLDLSPLSYELQVLDHKDLKHPKSNKISKDSLDKKLQTIDRLIDQYKSVISLDFEQFEFKQSLMLEAGVTIITKDKVYTTHYIVKEHMKYVNKRYVKGNRDNFLFGESLILPLREIVTRIRSQLEGSSCLVGQSVKGDLNFFNTFLPKNQPLNILTFDTSSLRTLYNCGGSLQTLCTTANIETKFLHNAGNDSHYSGLLLQNAIQYNNQLKLEDQ